jgi:hypothetical protein
MLQARTNTSGMHEASAQVINDKCNGLVSAGTVFFRQNTPHNPARLLFQVTSFGWQNNNKYIKLFD